MTTQLSIFFWSHQTAFSSPSVCTVPLKTFTAKSVEKAFSSRLIIGYGPPHILFSNDSFTSTLFQHVSQIFGIVDVVATIYQSQTNAQVERYNHNIISWLQHYVEQHPKDLDLYTDILTYSKISQMHVIHKTANCTSFKLVLFQPPMWMDIAIARMLREQWKSQKMIDKNIRPNRGQFQAGCLVIMRSKHAQCGAAMQKLVLTAENPYDITFTNETTVTLKSGSKFGSVSRNTLAASPVPST